MIIREYENSLFTEWQGSRDFNNFIPDGVVCPETWENNNSHKILFVLRDMNNPDEKRDLRNDLYANGSGWKTWNNIARWTVALLDENAEYPWYISSEDRAKQIRRIAVLNIKKDGGTARTNPYDLEESAKVDSQYLQRQIELYQPDVIICCGLKRGKYKSNMQLIREFVLEDSKLNRKDPFFLTDNGYEYFEAVLKSKKIIPVIQFYHPQVTRISGNRRGHENLYIPLFKDMQDMRKQFL